MARPPLPPWRKILFEKQPYEDNYTDQEKFLIGLRTNANFEQYHYWTVVENSTTIIVQISTVISLIIMFAYAFHGWISVGFMVTLDALLLFAGYLIRNSLDKRKKRAAFVTSLKSILILLGFLYYLSPVLRTLTDSFSDDTIWALTIIFLILHLFFNDYAYVNGITEKFEAPVSLNAALFASVLLGSRLPASMHVFALVFFAIELFALFPLLRHCLKQHSTRAHSLFMLAMFAVTAGFLFTLLYIAAVLYIGIVLFITLVCPKWLEYIQKYKNAINGPWDEAVPTIPEKSADGLQE